MTSTDLIPAALLARKAAAIHSVAGHDQSGKPVTAV